jgi:flagellar biosynthesis protein FliQ
MTTIIWILASILTLGLAVGLIAAYLAATEFDNMELNFEDGEDW